MGEEHISQNLKVLRKQKSMTQQELADLAGLTKSYLSKIERSHRAPPFSTLNRLANSLGVDVAFLMRDNGPQPVDDRITFTKRGRGQSVKTVGTFYGYGYEALATNKPGKNMIPYVIEPAFKENAMFQHDGEEFLYCLEGKHEFIYDGVSYMMEPGDSVYFDSGVPHTGRSVGNSPAKVLAIMFSYRRI